MKFISLIQSLFKRRRQPDRQAVKAPILETHRPTTNQTKSVASKQVQPQPVPTAPSVMTKRQARTSTVTVHYSDGQQALHASVKLTGTVGAELNMPWLKLTGYYLAEIVNLQRFFADEMAPIVLIYKPQLAAPVMVVHRDLEGATLVKPQFMRGALNEHYQAQPLAGGVNFVHHTSANQTGRFQQQMQTVTFQYDPLNLRYVDVPAEPFLQLRQPTRIYQRPTTDALVTGQLPKQSIWKIFGRAVTTTGQEWFHLGGFWIQPADYQLLASNPNQPQPYQVPPKFDLHYETLLTEDINLSAVVSGTITLWQAPYVGPATVRYDARTRVKIIQSVVLENQSRWYELEQHQWVLADLVSELRV